MFVNWFSAVVGISIKLSKSERAASKEIRHSCFRDAGLKFIDSCRNFPESNDENFELQKRALVLAILISDFGIFERAETISLAKTIAERLKTARNAVFVGRNKEQQRFQQILTGEAAPGVFWLHGPGGVGKSALLRVLAEEARTSDFPVYFVDGHHLEATPEAFLRALCVSLNIPISENATRDGVLEVLQRYLEARTRRVVIFVDTIEVLAPLELWWREEFLPALPENVFLVLAGRKAPDAAWSADAGWRDLIQVRALHNLDAATASEYLKRRAVPTNQHGALLQFTHGHPLALSLVADFFDQRRTQGQDAITLEFTPEDAPEVVRTLLAKIVADESSTEHRAALEACALVRLTTEDLLEKLLDGDAHQAFVWLRGLSFIETSRQGLFPHDMVREVLLADLRWRNPGQHRLLHERAREFYAARFEAASVPEQQRLLMDYVFLHRYNPLVRPFLDWRENNSLVSEPQNEPLRPDELQDLVAMVETHEGAESAAIARDWLRAQPQSVLLMRNSRGEVAAFLAMVSLTAASPEEIERDPATKAAWNYLESHAPLRPGEEATMTRFWMSRDTYQDTSPAQSLVFVNAVRHYLTTPQLAFSFFVCAAPEFYAPLFQYASGLRLNEADFKVGSHVYGVYGHDWRALPPLEWLDLLGQREVSSAPSYNIAPPPTLDVLTRDEFCEAVRNALRDWHRPHDLRKNRLLRTRVVVNRAGRNAGIEERVTALQSLIREACESMRGAKREGKFLRALYHGYIKPAPTQERAAEAMDVPFSTYRRYLKSGLDSVADFLWKREIGG